MHEQISHRLEEACECRARASAEYSQAQRDYGHDPGPETYRAMVEAGERLTTVRKHVESVRMDDDLFEGFIQRVLGI